MKNLNLNATCLFGLESILKFELTKIGAENIEVTDGRVSFSGDEAVLVRANLWLRTAERVNIVLGSFNATTFTELFDGVSELPFENYISKKDSFPVKGWSLDSQLKSIPSCQSIIKKSAVERLSRTYGVDFFEETGPVHQISFSIHKDEVTVMLDTSGETLHKRGYREFSNEAPIRETLAAGIADLARIREDSLVYDPMCGSGTLLIEAAQRAMNIAPGLNRSFEVESWGASDSTIWEQERQKAKDAIDHDTKFRAFGYDIDGDVLRTAQLNAAKAGVNSVVKFKQADIEDFSADLPSTVLCNPPYGERMLDLAETAELYKKMGAVFPKKKGANYYIITAQDDFEETFGRRADRRRKLYNGNLPCQLYMYFR